MDAAQKNVHSLILRLNAEEFGGLLDPVDIMAFCQIESRFDTTAYRYEKRLDDASYGLMQILTSAAKDRGFTYNDFALLFDPETGLRYGMRQVKWTADYLGKHLPAPVPIETIAAAYNAGVGNVLHGFHNAGYVSRFVSAKGYWINELAH